MQRPPDKLPSSLSSKLVYWTSANPHTTNFHLAVKQSTTMLCGRAAPAKWVVHTGKPTGQICSQCKTALRGESSISTGMMQRRGIFTLPDDHYNVLFGQETVPLRIETLDWESDWSWNSNVAVEMVLGRCLALVPKRPTVVVLLERAMEETT